MYLTNLDKVTPHQRVQILEQLSDAHKRLPGNTCSPIQGRLAELTGATIPLNLKIQRGRYVGYLVGVYSLGVFVPVGDPIIWNVI